MVKNQSSKDRRFSQKTAGNCRLGYVAVVRPLGRGPVIEARLLKDGSAGCAELGIKTSGGNAPMKLVVVEQTAQELNAVRDSVKTCQPLYLRWPDSRESIRRFTRIV